MDHVFKAFSDDAPESAIEEAWGLLQPPMWPADEIRPLADFQRRQREPVSGGNQLLICALGVCGQVDAMIVVHHLRDVGVGFGEYMMVRPGPEYVGIGKLLYQFMRTVLRGLGVSYLFLEYDSPIGIDEEGAKRWLWYYRIGVYRVKCGYLQPPYTARYSPKQMSLAFDFQLCGNLPKPELVVTAVKATYRLVYGVCPGDYLWKAQMRMMEDDLGSDWLLVDRSAYSVHMIRRAADVRSREER